MSLVAEQGYFRSSDGVRLFYSVEGPKDAPPLLFAYGLVCSKLNWKYQMQELKQRYRVIYMDYRGHGNSAVPEDVKTVTIENLAKDMALLCEELNLPPVCVLGHSLGVNVILEFVRRYPEKVAGIVLTSGTPKDPFETMFHHNFLQIFFPLLRLGNEFIPDVAAAIWKAQGKNRIAQEIAAVAGFNMKYVSREDVQEYMRVTSEVPFEVFLGLVTDFTNYDACVWLDEIRCPALIIGGERDLVTPLSMQKLLHRLIAGSQMEVIKEGSHNPQMEKMEEVNRLIERFLKRIGLRPAAGSTPARPVKKAKSKSKAKAKPKTGKPLKSAAPRGGRRISAER